MKATYLIWIIPFSLIVGFMVGVSFMSIDLSMDDNTRIAVEEMTAALKDSVIDTCEKEKYDLLNETKELTGAYYNLQLECKK